MIGAFLSKNTAKLQDFTVASIMARIKYYYDTETCKYERIRISKWDIFLNLLGFLSVAMILAIGIVFVFSTYFESPQVSLLKKENKELLLYYEEMQKELRNMDDMMAALQERDDDIYRVIFEADPIPATVREAGVGGTDRYRALRENRLKREKLVLESFEKIDKLKKKMYIQTKSYDDIRQLALNKTEMLASIPAIQPISNRELTRLASGFGMRMHPILKYRRMHAGIDFSAPQGTPIYATGDGKVTRASQWGSGGLTVTIDHGFGYETRYLHMIKFEVRQGDRVKRGDVIGYVGSTGMSSAPHCHYEVWKDGQAVNPVYYFYNDVSEEEFDKILDLASTENQSLG
jgi:murein DD-endopeptidase MepM/ murein hydrolase activator NlpD